MVVLSPILMPPRTLHPVPSNTLSPISGRSAGSNPMSSRFEPKVTPCNTVTLRPIRRAPITPPEGCAKKIPGPISQRGVTSKPNSTTFAYVSNFGSTGIPASIAARLARHNTLGRNRKCSSRLRKPMKFGRTSGLPSSSYWRARSLYRSCFSPAILAYGHPRSTVRFVLRISSSLCSRCIVTLSIAALRAYLETALCVVGFCYQPEMRGPLDRDLRQGAGRSIWSLLFEDSETPSAHGSPASKQSRDKLRDSKTASIEASKNRAYTRFAGGSTLLRLGTFGFEIFVHVR